jgi:CHAD domain-containing protein/CYTH domain-containing protein
MENMEIERKYLLKPCAPKRFLCSKKILYRKNFIQQYYLPKLDREYVRYRRKNDTYYKTIKSGEGMVREEYESIVPKEEFDRYLKEHVGAIIEKDRYVFDYGGMTYEMDRFRHDFKGLCYLEIEFENEEEAEHFVLPEVFASLVEADVTEDVRFTNAHLCMTGLVPVPEKHARSDGELAFEMFDGSRKVITSIMQDLASELERNRKAVYENSEDPETLHRLRVSLRKSRSILGLFAPFFSEKWYRVHDRELSYLMEQTDARRDIDVLLKNLPGYRSLLPGRVRKGLESLRILLEEQKSTLDLDIRLLTESEPLNYEISMFGEPKFSDIKPEQPILFVAMAIMHEQISEIIHRGKRLTSRSKVHAYHKLRIEYKKLRYFIETMQPLIGSKKEHKALKRLKKTQTAFGILHDYQVQQKLLFSMKEHPALRKKVEQKALRGVLKKIEMLKERQEHVCRKAFDHFLHKRTTIEKLFFI